MQSHKGFTLIEIMIAMALIGILATIATHSWNTYINKANLRTAAREIASDISTMKQKAVANSATTYSIVFNKTNAEDTFYTLSDGGTKRMSTFGRGIVFTAFPNSGSEYTLNFLSRGTLSSIGTINLQNSEGWKATIRFTITGRVYVDFTQ